MNRLLAALVAMVVTGMITAGALAAAVDRPAAAKRTPAVKLRTTGLGRVVVDARGRTLYLFEKDRRGRSACYGACATAWPPALVRGRLVAGKGIARARLGTTRRRGGKRQLTYGGHPLYRFIQDGDTPGSTKGQEVDAFGAEWYVVGRSGRKISGKG
jgi:predicted lipoprotein with Yx(FWY)xxD motif